MIMLHRMTCCDERSVMRQRCSPLSQPVELLSNSEGLEKYKNVPNISFRPGVTMGQVCACYYSLLSPCIKYWLAPASFPLVFVSNPNLCCILRLIDWESLILEPVWLIIYRIREKRHFNCRVIPVYARTWIKLFDWLININKVKFFTLYLFILSPTWMRGLVQIKFPALIEGSFICSKGGHMPKRVWYVRNILTTLLMMIRSQHSVKQLRNNHKIEIHVNKVLIHTHYDRSLH